MGMGKDVRGRESGEIAEGVGGDGKEWLLEGRDEMKWLLEEDFEEELLNCSWYLA